MDKNTVRKVKNDNTRAVVDDKLASLMNDFELIAQAASHDLKDPLRQAIIDFETLKNEYHNKPLDAAALANIQLAIEAIGLVVRRIEILRTYSRLVQNKKPFSEIQGEELVQKALAQLKPIIEKRHANITFDPLPKVFGNGEQLIELWRHLIDNGIRFCPDKTPNIHISAQDKGDVWEFSIQDNGIGIDPVYREFVFAVFQCLDNESPSRSDGIGLTFSKKIVQNHGGAIRYESDGENGTCFYFTLPKR